MISLLFFKILDGLVYCNDVDGLMCKLGIAYSPMEWRLFIDSSISSLKAVLLHIGNEKSSMPIAHRSHMKEIYENLNNLM